MKKFLLCLLMVAIIAGTIFGIKYEIDYYNGKYESKDEAVKEEPVEETAEEIFNTLTIPNLYDLTFATNVQPLFYDLDTIEISTMSNAMKLMMVANNIRDKEYDKSSTDSSLKLKGSDMKEYYQKLFGNIEYIPETFTFFEATTCSRIYTYDSTTDIYNIALPGCDGRTGPAEWMPYIEKYNIEKDNNNIYIDYYVASYMKVNEEENDPNPITIYDKIFNLENKLYTGTDLNEMNHLIKDGKISKYRLTYSKQNDNKYYFNKGSWLNA